MKTTENKKAGILLVDDNPANLMALQAVLTSPDYELVEVRSGFEAVALCEQREFALILLDISMPGMDGYEAAFKIKQSGKNRDVPIIFVTATYQEDPYVKKGYAVGAIDYFGKPFEPEILKAKVSIYTQLYLKTKRLEETEELLKSHAQIKTLLEAIPLGIIIANSDGEIYECNEQALRIWEEKCTVDLVQNYKRKGWWEDNGTPITENQWPLARALHNGDIIQNEVIKIEVGQGHVKTVSISAFPIRGKSNQILGAVAVTQDLTERMEIANDLHRRATQILKDLKSLN